MSSLRYTNQPTIEAIGSIDEDGNRVGSTLSGTYSDNRYEFSSDGYSKINIDMLYTMDAAETGNGISLIVEGSPNGDHWYRIPNETVSGGTSTLEEREFVFTGNDGSTKALSVGLDTFYKHMRISFTETDVGTTNGTIFAQLTLCE